MASAKFREYLMFLFFEYPEKCYKASFKQRWHFHFCAKCELSPVVCRPCYEFSEFFSLSKMSRIFLSFSLSNRRNNILTKNCALFSHEISKNAENEFPKMLKRSFGYREYRYCKKHKIPFPPQHAENTVSSTCRNPRMNTSQITVVQLRQKCYVLQRDGDTDVTSSSSSSFYQRQR